MSMGGSVLPFLTPVKFQVTWGFFMMLQDCEHCHGNITAPTAAKNTCTANSAEYFISKGCGQQKTLLFSTVSPAEKREIRPRIGCSTWVAGTAALLSAASSGRSPLTRERTQNAEAAGRGTAWVPAVQTCSRCTCGGHWRKAGRRRRGWLTHPGIALAWTSPDLPSRQGSWNRESYMRQSWGWSHWKPSLVQCCTLSSSLG